jgi:arginyl-tRNA synthetase
MLLSKILSRQVSKSALPRSRSKTWLRSGAHSFTRLILAFSQKCRARVNNYTFNWDRMTSFEGDTGPYLQYAHVRLTSLTRKNPELLPLPPPADIATETLAEHPAAREIAFLLGTYPDVVRTALRTHEPSGVVTFAFRLAHAISSAWETVVVKGEADVERARARMWLYLCARDVLGAAMRLLSIRPLERM